MVNVIYPYDLIKSEKHLFLLEKLNELTTYHIKNSKKYQNIIMKSRSFQYSDKLDTIPYLPVQLFKLTDLKSVADNDVIKILTSSGTTGQQVSKIYLDKETSVNQTKALVEVMKPIIGGSRLPMIILDTKSVLKDRNSFSARGAGILGFSNFGRKHFYALNDDMSVAWKGLIEFVNEYKTS
jgi:hypothetical protein